MNVVYFGSGDIGLPSLRLLLNNPAVNLLAVVTQPDRPSGRGLEVRPSNIKKLALSHNVAVLQPKKIKAAEAMADIAALNPDLIVVMAYGQILPRSILDIARFGALNLHASLLPRHRGAAPVNAAILAGDRMGGITVMWMDEGLDTGDILLQQTLNLASDETAGTLHDRLAELAPDALNQALERIRTGDAPRIRQDEKLATYAPKLDRSSGRIDWSLDAVEIERRIRAFHPWPGSTAEFTLADGGTVAVKIHKAVAEEGVAERGNILEDLRVGCGDGLLRILELQPSGGKKMDASSFLRGRPVIHAR